MRDLLIQRQTWNMRAQPSSNLVGGGIVGVGLLALGLLHPSLVSASANTKKKRQGKYKKTAPKHPCLHGYSYRVTSLPAWIFQKLPMHEYPYRVTSLPA